MPCPDKNAAIASIVEPLRAPYTETTPPVELEETDIAEEVAPSDTHILDLPHATRTYKLLLSGGHYNNTTKTLHITDSTLPPTFASACWDAITSDEAGGVENARQLAKGDAMFVMVEMIEGLVKSGRGEEVKAVLGGEDVLSGIDGSGKKGASLLVEKIRAL
jgi:pumilio family protein 6